MMLCLIHSFERKELSCKGSFIVEEVHQLEDNLPIKPHMRETHNRNQRSLEVKDIYFGSRAEI